jgi:hypothetical protein
LEKGWVRGKVSCGIIWKNDSEIADGETNGVGVTAVRPLARTQPLTEGRDGVGWLLFRGKGKESLCKSVAPRRQSVDG